jgi:low affinity Fe/Cu permease
VSDYLDKFADHVSDGIGSNLSILIHTIAFLAFAWLYYLGVDATQILLILTTLVSIEAIYLSVMIQRSVNKQTHKMDRMINSIRLNTVPHLKEPLDVVVGEIKTEVDDLETRIKRMDKTGAKKGRRK